MGYAVRPNPYYSPEKLGLTVVTTLEANLSWEFDMVVLWRDSEGKLWAAQDAGCSCPTPFEDHAFPTDFTEVRMPADVDHLIGRGYGFAASDVASFRRQVVSALDS